jgi:outer membrane protein OmpA-like peptidoglycan-associated protein
MSSNFGTLRGVTPASVAGTHAEGDHSLHILVGPATEEQHNTIRPTIIPLACWRADDITFDFGSTLPLPGIGEGLRHLSQLIDDHSDKSVEPLRKPPLSIFGHADPVGDDAFNKQLSGRRAHTIYALLIRDTKVWEKLHQDDAWGGRGDQIMLTRVGFETGRDDGVMDQKSRDAAKAFQKSKGLKDDGIVGPKTREQLFLAYMDALCVDDKEQPFTIAKTEFLGQNKDPDGKADYQGCGEFNPALLFSQEEDTKFKNAKDKSERNRENAPNRRVMILLFRPGSAVDPAKWPCPRAKEGIDGCKARFWSDSQRRLALGEERRRFEDTKDTFACRFYHRLTDRSPCERLPPPPKGMGFLAVRIFFHAEPMRGLHLQFHELKDGAIGAAVGPELVTDETGFAVHRDPVILGNYVCQIEHQKPRAVCTHIDTARPEILVLPIGRQYVNLDGDIEFKPAEGDENIGGSSA